MQEHLMNLLHAQEIDLEIDNLKRAKKDYPAQIESLKKEIDDLESAVADLERRIAENKKSRMMIEEEIAAERDVLVKKEKRLLETKTNKEYTAVQHEIEGAREKIDRLETEDIELMTELDQLEPELEAMKEKLEAVKKENNSNISEIKAKYDSIETDIADRENHRDAILQSVDKRPLAVYTRLRKGRSGIAVSRVDHRKYSCTGCFKQLPPQKVLEVRRGNRLIFCESCGRILVWDNREENE